MRKRKILFINPSCSTDFLNSSVVNAAMGKTCFFPSLSLMTIAALTPKDRFDVELFDEYLGKTVEEVAPQADLYALTCYDPNRDRAHEICRWLKAQGKTVVLGGPHATHHHAAIASAEPYDALFAGDAELTWPRFLDEWERGTHQRIYLESTKVDLAHTPVARWDLCDADKYLTAVMQTSRGCPFSCEFCDAIILYGNHVRVKPIETVMAELEIIYRRGFQSVLIGDDNFTAKRKYAKDLLRRIAAWREDKDPLFVLGAQLSIDVARDDELLALMARAGLVFAYVGIESSNKEALKGANKLHNLRSDMRADVEKIHSYGISVMSGLIVGFDEDGPEIFNRHVEFCRELALPVCNTYLLSAPYGTPLRARLEKEGRVTANFALGELLTSNIVPKQMTSGELIGGFRWMTTQLFDPDGFAERLDRKFAVFRTRSTGPAGKMSWAIRRKHYALAARIFRYTVTHHQAARELAGLLRRALPTMIKRPAFINDIFQDLMIFIRFKRYYEQMGAYREELRHAGPPETWTRARRVAASRERAREERTEAVAQEQ
ncbi:MAG: radical SAM protein [Deltaproteobacteria bacterium]|nr:radical SAM protein [Deltaproteobacteria bacterium]